MGINSNKIVNANNVNTMIHKSKNDFIELLFLLSGHQGRQLKLNNIRR